MLKVGIECESIENDSWGIARIINKLLEEIARRPELQKEFKFFLYFKSKIPDYPYLDNPIFHKEVVWQPFPYKSFVLYYYVFLPIRLWFAGLDAMFYPNYMLPIIHLGKSLVLLTDDIWHEMRSAQQRFHHRLAYWVFGYWGAWFASRIMAISETSKKELVRLFGINPARITVNHLAVDTPHEAARKDIRPYILFVGQAFPRRHLKETLEAFERIAPDFPDLDFQIVGTDKYTPRILPALAEEINARLGSRRIRHTAYATDEELAEHYANAKAVTYISSREAFGLPPLEALAYGSVPVVADNAMSHEILGDNGFFVPDPDSAASIADTLRDMLTNAAKYESVRHNARRVAERFTWKAHADRFIRIVKDLNHA